MHLFLSLLLLTVPLTRALDYSNVYMTCLVNKARQQAGLDPLGIDDNLVKAAQQHSDDMARSNNMDHTGSDGSSPGDRAQRAGFNWSAVAENIAFGQSSMDDVMNTWMNSPGHRENILNPSYKMFGSAVSMSGSTPYYTQDFGSNGQAATNVPTCDGNYPDMSAGGQPSGGGGSGGGGDSGYGTPTTKHKSGGSRTPSYGGGHRSGGGGRRGGNGGRRRHRDGGSFADQPSMMMDGDLFDTMQPMNDNQWFGQMGFGQNPFKSHGDGMSFGNGGFGGFGGMSSPFGMFGGGDHGHGRGGSY